VFPYSTEPLSATEGASRNAPSSCVQATPGDVLRFTTCNYHSLAEQEHQDIGMSSGRTLLRLAFNSRGNEFVEVQPSVVLPIVAGCANCSSSRGREYVRRKEEPFDWHWTDGGCGLASGLGSNFIYRVPSPKRWGGEFCLKMGCFRGEECSMTVVFYRNGALEKVPGLTSGSSKESCSAGHICNAPCPLGTASTLANATHAAYCEACAAGFYSGAEMGASSCTMCAAGTFSSRVGAVLPTSCQPCPEGTYSPSGATMCIPCEAGTYADQGSAQVCKRCPWGHYSLMGSSGCYPCPKGTFASGTQGGCEPCAPGSYAPEEGMPRCLPCEHGEVTPLFGAESCQPCDSNS
jgi:hypothetical protein